MCLTRRTLSLFKTVSTIKSPSLGWERLNVNDQSRDLDFSTRISLIILVGRLPFFVKKVPTIVPST